MCPNFLPFIASYRFFWVISCPKIFIRVDSTESGIVFRLVYTSFIRPCTLHTREYAVVVLHRIELHGSYTDRGGFVEFVHESRPDRY